MTYFAILTLTHARTRALGTGLLGGVESGLVPELAYCLRRLARLETGLHPTETRLDLDWTAPEMRYRARSSTRDTEEKGTDRQDNESGREIDAGMGRDAALRNDKEALGVAIIAENVLLTTDGSTITLAHLQHLAATRVHALLLGPESGMHEYAGARLFSTFGVSLKVYPGLEINLYRAADPLSKYPDRDERPYNLPTYAEIFGRVFAVSSFPLSHFLCSRLSPPISWDPTSYGPSWLFPLSRSFCVARRLRVISAASRGSPGFEPELPVQSSAECIPTSTIARGRSTPTSTPLRGAHSSPPLRRAKGSGNPVGMGLSFLGSILSSVPPIPLFIHSTFFVCHSLDFGLCLPSTWTQGFRRDSFLNRVDFGEGRAWGTGSFEPFLPSFLPSLHTSLPLHPILIPHRILPSPPIHRSPALRTTWASHPPPTSFLRREKNLGLMVWGLRSWMAGGVDVWMRRMRGILRLSGVLSHGRSGFSRLSGFFFWRGCLVGYSAVGTGVYAPEAYAAAAVRVRGARRIRPFREQIPFDSLAVRSRTKLVFIGDAPYLSTLQRLCAQLGVDAVFMGQLTGRRLGEAVGADFLYFWERVALGGGAERSPFGLRSRLGMVLWRVGRGEGMRMRLRLRVRVWEEQRGFFVGGIRGVWTATSDLVHVARWLWTRPCALGFASQFGFCELDLDLDLFLPILSSSHSVPGSRVPQGNGVVLPKEIKRRGAWRVPCLVRP
ncbi:hypothetical protein B0H13DRAFT_2415303 [Mycena leptocephala]|nr:hypothetical protein B0H13DRAFT_2415303 [Mycena leptocephala]